MIYVRTDQLIAARAYANAKAAYEANPTGQTGRAMADAEEALDIATLYDTPTREYVERIVAAEPKYTRLSATVLGNGKGSPHQYTYTVFGIRVGDAVETLVDHGDGKDLSQGDALTYVSNAITHYGVPVAEILVRNIS